MVLLKAAARGSIRASIYESIREAILSGGLGAGARLPSSRDLAAEAGVSRNSVLTAYDQLMAEGYIIARKGSGTYVAPELPDDMSAPVRAGDRGGPAPPAQPPLSAYGRRTAKAPGELPASRPAGLRYDFRYGLPPADGFPYTLWRKKMGGRLRRMSQQDMQYAPPEGYGPLREAIAAYLSRHRGVESAPGQIIVVSGSQQALDLTARMLLDPGDGVLIEEPHYLGARYVFLAAGARLIPAPAGPDGLDLSAAPRAAARAKLAYVTPSHQFPTGGVMPLARRLELLGWAGRTGAYVIEDDYDSEFRYGGRPVEAIQALDRSGRVIYMGTFSKTMFPALRIGYLVLPPALVEPFKRAKWLADRHTPVLEQEAMADFIGDGDYERHLRRSRQRSASRRAALLEALEAHLGGRTEVWGANAGLHLLVWLNGVPGRGLDPLIGRAAEAGVGIYSAFPYYLKPPPRAGLLLGFASMNEKEIPAGIRILARVMG